MKFKITTCLIAGGVMLLANSPIVSFADAVSQQSVTSVTNQNQNKETRTLITTARGHLEGSLTPYIKGLPFTGNISLHYSAKNTGFVDGDVAVLTVKLPDEFKTVASVPNIAEHVTGKINTQTLLGEKQTDITPEMVECYPDRIIIHTPHNFWVGVGQVSADITMNYGAALVEYPTIPIPDAPNGYEFVTQLKYSSAMWDVIKDPIIGTNTDTFTTKDISAIS